MSKLSQTINCQDGHQWATPSPGFRNRCEVCGYLGAIFEPKKHPGRNWLVLQTECDEVHCVPIEDLVGHCMDDTCPCLPTLELTLNTNVGNFSRYSHNAWDGRE